MRVENHTGRFQKIPIMTKGGANGAIVESYNVTLFPGVNEVDPKRWAECEKIAHVKNLIELGERKGGFVVGDPGKSLKTLAEVNEKTAIETVEETVDAKLLATWKASDKREKVLEAIAAQFEKIDPKADRVNTVRAGAVGA